MKKTAFFLLFLFISSAACAHEESDQWKYTHLEDQRKRLSAEYEGKIKDLSELTMKIHEIDAQLDELKLKIKESRTRTVGNLPAKYS